jgi:hypothetical protein
MRPHDKIPRHSYQDASDDPAHRDPMGKPRKRSMSRFVPFLAFAIFALVIVSQEVPEVSNAIDRLINPAEFDARTRCEKEAMKLAGKPDFARIIKQGEVVSTQNGKLVKGIVMGEMNDQGQEIRVPFHCYLDASGNIVSSGRTER